MACVSPPGSYSSGLCSRNHSCWLGSQHSRYGLVNSWPQFCPQWHHIQSSEPRQEWSLSKAKYDVYKQENNSQVGWSTHVATGLCWLATVLACAPRFPASPPGCPHRWQVSRSKHLNLTPHVKTWQVIKHFLLDQSYMRER